MRRNNIKKSTIFNNVDSILNCDAKSTYDLIFFSMFNNLIIGIIKV